MTDVVFTERKKSSASWNSRRVSLRHINLAELFCYPTHPPGVGIKDVCSCNRFSCIFACDIWYIYSIISKISRSRGLLLNQIVIKKSINKYTIVIIYWFILKKNKSFLTIKLEFSNMIRDINTNYFSMLYLVFSHWYRLTLVLMYVSDMM